MGDEYDGEDDFGADDFNEPEEEEPLEVPQDEDHEPVEVLYEWLLEISH